MMTLNVPPELAGDPTNLKYDNAADVMKNWMLVNGKAYANSVAEYLTDILRYFEPHAAVYFSFDFTPFEQADAAMVQADYAGKPIHIDTLIQVSRDVSAFTGQPPAPALPVYTPGQMTIPGQVNPPALPEPVEEPEPQKGAASLCVMLTFANDPDLITKLSELKKLYPDPAIRWIDPADLHITLLIAPSVDDEQLAALPEAMEGYSIEGLSLL
jgi:hypothetical protein